MDRHDILTTAAVSRTPAPFLVQKLLVRPLLRTLWAVMLVFLARPAAADSAITELPAASPSPQADSGVTVVPPSPLSDSCSTLGAVEGQALVRITGAELAVVSKKPAAMAVCAVVKLPDPATAAIAQDGVVFIALLTNGLVLVNLGDPVHPSFGPTLDPEHRIESMRIGDGYLWTVDSANRIAKYKLTSLVLGQRPQLPVLPPPGEKPPQAPATAVIRVEIVELAHRSPPPPPPPPPPKPPIRVRIDANRTISLSAKATGDESVQPEVCHIQRGVLELPGSSQTYLVSGDGIPQASFRLPPYPRALVKVRTGSSRQRTLGLALTGLGGGGILAGSIVVLSALLSSIHLVCDRNGCSNEPYPGKDTSSYHVGGGIAVGVGLLGLGYGIYSLVTSGTSVEVSPDHGQVALRLRDTGVRLSARGLEF